MLKHRGTSHDRTLAPLAARIADANLTRFMQCLNARRGMRLHDYDELYAWSIAQPAAVLERACALCRRARRLRRRPRSSRTPARCPAPASFPNARLNFAENLLKFRRRAAGAGIPQRAWHAPCALVPRAARGSGAHRRTGSAPAAWSPAIGSPASCRICPRPRSRCSPPRASGPSGLPARRTSACTGCSIASDRSRPRCCSPRTATSTRARRLDSLEPMAAVLGKLASVSARGADPLRRCRAQA